MSEPMPEAALVPDPDPVTLPTCSYGAPGQRCPEPPLVTVSMTFWRDGEMAASGEGGAEGVVLLCVLHGAVFAAAALGEQAGREQAQQQMVGQVMEAIGDRRIE